MDILFVTFGELSVGGGNARSVSVLYALADAGHQVDVIASRALISEHPHINVLSKDSGSCISRNKLRTKTLRVTKRGSYDVVHAVDTAVSFIYQICKLRKLPLIYDASRCFTGTVGLAPSRLWTFFPEYFRRREKRILQYASVILTSCKALTDDLTNKVPAVVVVEIKDVPFQSLISRKEVDRSALLNRFKEKTSALVVCRILNGSSAELHKVLMTARKISEVIPHVSFFFKGVSLPEAKTVARNLDLSDRCIFLEPDEIEDYLEALDCADTALFVPHSGERYIRPELLTMLRSPAPVVAVHDEAYDDLLTDQNSMQVFSSAESIADGVIRVIKEPLFSIGIVTEGQKLISENYSFASFKHKIRMAYYEVMNNA